jgi:hypothetical protein
VTSPTLALPGGDAVPIAAWAVAVWPPAAAGRTPPERVLAAEQRSDGSYGQAIQISPAGEVADGPVGVATKTDAVIVWDTGRCGNYGLGYAVHSRSGFHAARLLTNGRTGSPAVLASAANAVVAAWISRGTGGRTGVQLAVLRDLKGG